MTVTGECQEAQPPTTPIDAPNPLPDLAFNVEPKRYFEWRSELDRLLAAVLLVPAAPTLLLSIAVVRLTSRGPAIYRQVRTGVRGKSFTMLKIRTMRGDAEEGKGEVWQCKNDPRVTRVGRVLRKLHLDEFPQLFNVLRGEMALIGPRPERPGFVEVLKEEIPDYADRLVVLPGITGLAQINLPADNTVDDVRRKVALDLMYIEEADPWLDVRMLLCTCVRATGIPGDLMMQVFGVHRDCRRYGYSCRCATAGDGDGEGELRTPEELRAARAAAQQCCNAVEAHQDGNGNGNGNGNGRGESKQAPDAPLGDISHAAPPTTPKCLAKNRSDLPQKPR